MHDAAPLAPPHRVNDQFPELKELQPLPLTELATRLVHLFAKCAREPPAADLGAGGGAAPVAGDLLRELADYLYLADQSYEGATEAQLSWRLQRKGARPACRAALSLRAAMRFPCARWPANRAARWALPAVGAHTGAPSAGWERGRRAAVC